MSVLAFISLTGGNKEVSSSSAQIHAHVRECKRFEAGPSP